MANSTKDRKGQQDCGKLEGRSRVICELYQLPDIEDRICCARHLHRKLKRLLHRWQEVVATDVGFLVRESEEEFVSEVGIRIHVREKLDEEDLRKQGKRNLAWPGLISSLKKSYLFFLIKKSVDSKERKNRIYYDKEKDGWKTDQDTEKMIRCNPGHYRLYIEHENADSDVSIPGCRNKHSCVVPIDVISVEYFPSNLGVQVGPSLPNSEGFRDDGSRRLGRHRVEPLVGGVSLGNQRGSAECVNGNETRPSTI